MVALDLEYLQDRHLLGSRMEPFRDLGIDFGAILQADARAAQGDAARLASPESKMILHERSGARFPTLSRRQERNRQ